ncbi:thymidylate synthase [Ureibacillus chungkukjangi]|uniref:thymidylate synthase n=1 Tax=Ureibacillus chungkukjangi TaxID=1202712 RepID=UPI00203B51B5|nr:thymidylate synthase [Ureibacillus chungkukjangi]MCM3387179.1 thymidylate synthase [Ureibacillus chungkukjangi]
MSIADDIYINDLLDIHMQDWEIDNRAKWKDGTQVSTRRITQVFHAYDLHKGFPILTLREINWKKAIDEIIWIYFKRSNNVNDLNSSIWDSWKDENNEIFKAYGHQIAQPTMGYDSQIEYVIGEIKRNPTSRRIMMNMFNADDQLDKATKSLIECAYATHFTVKNGKLDMTLIQRSGDKHTAAGFGGWNTVQYAFLQHAIAQECNLDVGAFAHFIQDLHEYNKHQEVGEKLIMRHREIYIPTKVKIKIADKPIFELTADDVKLIGYEHMGKLNIPDVAI